MARPLGLRRGPAEVAKFHFLDVSRWLDCAIVVFSWSRPLRDRPSARCSHISWIAFDCGSQFLGLPTLLFYSTVFGSSDGNIKDPVCAAVVGCQVSHSRQIQGL